MQFKAKIFKSLHGRYYVADILTDNKDEVLQSDLFKNTDCLNDLLDVNQLAELYHNTAVEIDANITYEIDKYAEMDTFGGCVSLRVWNVEFYV